MTKKEIFAEIANLAVTANRDDIVEFCNKEIELLNKRSSKDSKAALAKKAEREALAEKVLDVLSNSTEPLRTMEIASALEISPQKATPILKALATANSIEVVKESKVIRYKVA